METILNIVREQGDPVPSQGENGEEEEVINNILMNINLFLLQNILG